MAYSPTLEVRYIKSFGSLHKVLVYTYYIQEADGKMVKYQEAISTFPRGGFPWLPMYNTNLEMESGFYTPSFTDYIEDDHADLAGIEKIDLPLGLDPTTIWTEICLAMKELEFTGFTYDTFRFNCNTALDYALLKAGIQLPSMFTPIGSLDPNVDPDSVILIGLENTLDDYGYNINDIPLPTGNLSDWKIMVAPISGTRYFAVQDLRDRIYEEFGNHGEKDEERIVIQKLTEMGCLDISYSDNFNWYIVGLNEREWLFGGAKEDFIFAGGGADYLYGNGGSDTLYGGRGNDHLYGGEGEDHLYGGEDNDVLYGGADNDVLYGDDEDNLLTGNDHLYGEGGSDKLYGGKGTDHLYGDGGPSPDGKQYIETLDPGNDYLYGGEDSDYLHGGNGKKNYDILVRP